MQSFSFTYYITVLMVATLIVSTRCDTSTTTPGETSPIAAVSSETPSTNNHPATDTMVQNDDSKVESTSVTPTRLPTSDAATLSPKPSIVHDVTSTQATTPSVLNNTTPMVNGSDSMGNMAAKKGAGSGSSKGSPGFMVISTMIIVVSAIYA